MIGRKGFSAVELAVSGALLGGLSLLVAKNANNAMGMMKGVTRKSAFVKIESAFTMALTQHLAPNFMDSTPTGCGRGLGFSFSIPNLGTATLTRNVGVPIPTSGPLSEMEAAAQRCQGMGSDTSPLKMPSNQSEAGGLAFCVKFQKTNQQLPNEHFLSSEIAFAEVRVNLVDTKNSNAVFGGPFLSCFSYRMNTFAGMSLYYRAYWKPSGSGQSFQSVDGRSLFPRSGNGSGETYVNLVAKHSNKCADVSGAALANGTSLIQYQCLGSDHNNQLFKLVPLGDAYQLIAKHSGRCLDALGWATANYSPVGQWDCTGNNNQLWKIFEITPGSNWYQIKPVHTSPTTSTTAGKCLSVNGGNAATGNGQGVVLYDCLGDISQNQLWKMAPPEPYLSAGFFYYNNVGYHTNGQGLFCSFDTASQWASYGGPASGAPTYSTFPNTMSYMGRCLTWEQLYVLFLYEKLLHRIPHINEMAPWVGALNASDPNSRAQIVRGIAGSGEYSNRYPDNWVFIWWLYNDLLERPADSAGATHWFGQLASGVSRLGVVDGFIGSDEFILKGGIYDPMYGLPPGSFRYAGGIFYSNGQMGYCWFSSWAKWKAAGGGDDISRLPQFNSIPSVMVGGHPCN